MASAQNVQILSTGSYVPDTVITNAEISSRLGEPIDEWLVKNVGIQERRVMSAAQTTSDLVVEAARHALQKAGLSPRSLDLIIVATDTPDYLSPATSVVVQHKLGAQNAGTFDVNAACTGWVTALDVGARYLMTEEGARYVLVAGGYGMTRFLDYRDKPTAGLFADGAGVVILRKSEAPGFLGSKLLSRGEYHDALGIYTGGAHRPATAGTVAQSGPPSVRFVRKFPKTFNSDHWPPLIKDLLARAGLALADVGLFLFTQLNLRTIEAVMDLLGQPMVRTHTIMEKWGYTGSACLPMALDDALASRGPLAEGTPVVFCASGGGLTMAVSLWRWKAS